jgi:hypothetical protein
MTKEMLCPEKARLIAEYQKTTQEYSEAVAQLQRIMGVSLKTDYEAQYRMTEALRHDSIKAREELEQHIAIHGC